MEGDKNPSHYGGQDKSRGVKHRKGKEKYKPKSVKDPKLAPGSRKSMRNLGSNWDRYKNENDSQTPQLSSSTDFSILANAPIVQGQHFQFKQDKIITEEINKTPQQLFSLDLNMLKHSILAVPFYERIGIDEKYFTSNQLNFMNKDAENRLSAYNEKYNCNKINVKEAQEPCESNDTAATDQTENLDVSDLSSNESEANENISEIVTKMEDLAKAEMNMRGDPVKEDLEQWLDDILDD